MRRMSMQSDAGAADRRTSFLRGTADLCLLVAVGDRPGHAYELATRLGAAGLGPISYGTVYPLLARLRTQGLVIDESRPSSRGPERKVYALTASGRVAARQWAAQWRDLHATVAGYLDRHLDPPDRDGAGVRGDERSSSPGGHELVPKAQMVPGAGRDPCGPGPASDDDVPLVVRRVLRRVDLRLRALGLAATARQQVRDDVRSDLVGAHRDGLAPEEVVPDSLAFADDIATSLGLSVPANPQPMYARLLASGAAAVAVAVAAAYWAFLPGLYWLVDHAPVGIADSGWVPIAVYAVYGLFFTATVLVGIRVGLVSARRVRQTVVRVAVLLPASAALSLPAALLLARSTGFNASLPVVAAEGLIIVGCAAGALLAARRWAVTTASAQDAVQS